jgi:prefoldin subunit 5
MTQARITALEAERNLLRTTVERLQAQVDLLGPENARLTEALANAGSNSVLATMLIGAGGGIVSYATFTGQVAPALANVGAGCLLGGIAVMAFQTIRRWQRR